MSCIDLWFTAEMEEAIRSGRKCCTSRQEPHGQPGDIFRVLNGVFQIVDVIQVELAEIADLFFRLEGFDSPQEFRDFWEQVYHTPISGWDMAYVHFFSRLGGAS